MEIERKGVILEATKGDIINQPDIEAIVNAANAQLRTGGGVAGAIHSAAGYGLERETESLAPIKPGEAVITGGHELPNEYVIHCLGPVYGKDDPSDELLTDCYRNAFRRAIENDVRSIAFPAISTGAFGYPPEEACEIALNTSKEMLDQMPMDRIRFVLYSEDDYNLYCEKMDAIFGK